jgi:hypothetical protein
MAYLQNASILPYEEIAMAVTGLWCASHMSIMAIQVKILHTCQYNPQRHQTNNHFELSVHEHALWFSSTPKASHAWITWK